jgi:hypothetical protein
MNIEQAMLDPTSVFSCPDDVLDEQSLTREQKVKILRQWEYDARQLEVAEDENMAGGPSDLLDNILAALNELNAHIDLGER